MQTIGELWESIAKLSSHIVEDNKVYNGDYPKSVRDDQLLSIKTMIGEIERHHQTTDQNNDTSCGCEELGSECMSCEVEE